MLIYLRYHLIAFRHAFVVYPRGILLPAGGNGVELVQATLIHGHQAIGQAGLL